MTATDVDLAARLAELRDTFDGSFAHPPRDGTAELVDLLSVEAGTDRYVVRVAALAGVVADRPVTPLPDSGPDLLGVVGVRGQLIPVYDLAACLGDSRCATPSPRWLLLAAGTPPLAFAVDSLAGHLRLPLDGIAPATHPGGPADAVARTADGPRAVVNVPALRALVGTAPQATATVRGREPGTSEEEDTDDAPPHDV